MRCLSLWQPWASLLVTGKKRAETRSWPISHRGPLLIHAAKHWDSEISSLLVREPFKDALESFGVFHINPFTKPTGLPLGFIVGRVDVVNCFATANVRMGLTDGTLLAPVEHEGKLCIPPTEAAFGDYSPGRFAFLCENAVQFANPIPFRGFQGLFDVSDELVKEAK